MKTISRCMRNLGFLLKRQKLKKIEKIERDTGFSKSIGDTLSSIMSQKIVNYSKLYIIRRISV